MAGVCKGTHCMANIKFYVLIFHSKLWNGAHQEEENDEVLKLPGRKGLEDCWRKRD